MIRELLENNKPIPTTAKHNVVVQIMNHMVQELAQKLGEKYIWMATATVAVEAGVWGAKRRIKRRQKLARMIRTCATFAHVPDPTADLPKGWETHGLMYGYGVLARVQEETGVPVTFLIAIAKRTSGGVTYCFADCLLPR